MKNPISRIKTFYGEVIQEIKKCSWPARPELMEHTALIIVTIAILSVFIFAVDNICQYGIRGIFIVSEYLTGLFS